MARPCLCLKASPITQHLCDTAARSPIRSSIPKTRNRALPNPLRLAKPLPHHQVPPDPGDGAGRELHRERPFPAGAITTALNCKPLSSDAHLRRFYCPAHLPTDTLALPRAPRAHSKDASGTAFYRWRHGPTTALRAIRITATVIPLSWLLWLSL